MKMTKKLISILLACMMLVSLLSISAFADTIVYGDADGDGEVTALDQALLQQIVAGWEVDVTDGADADGDGEVTALDLALVQQFVAGWDVDFGPSEPTPPACEHQYFDACSPICELCGEEREVSHNIVHVTAVAPTCTSTGNIEYWFCDACGAAWLDEACTLNTNLRAVNLPMAEHEFFNDCETVCINCYQEVREASHTVIHVEAVAPTCTTAGNIEYWYCEVCGAAWLDAECTLNTNLRAVKLPATGEHVYDDEYDADCNECGEEREVEEKIYNDGQFGSW